MKERKKVIRNNSDSNRNISPKSIIITEEDIYYYTNNKDSLTKTIYEKLISKFINNELVPGQMLNRRQLAEELGVSVAPVLEALILLEQDGFIEGIPRKGTIVRPVREQDVYERYILREALECAAARLYAGLPIRQNKAELLAYAKKLDDEDINSIPHIKGEIIFHASLVNLAGISPLAREFLRATRVGMFYLINQVTFHKDTTRQNHATLIRKLTTDNPDEAEKIIREHIWSGKPDTRQYRLDLGLIRR